MKVLSVNTGKPKTYTLGEATVRTSMVREPQSQIEVTFKQVIGDKFSVPKYHGKPSSVVYALSSDRYPEWSKFLKREIPNGFWGENLSVDKLREEDFFIHDEYEVGTTLLKVTGPRYPCNRLNFVSGNPKMQQEFAERAWPGVYFEVLREGVIKAGDKLVLKKRVQEDVNINDLFLVLRDIERRNPINDNTRKVFKLKGLLEEYVQKIAKFYKLS